MATHSTILAWRTPWTVKPGGLQSMGTQKVAYDRATSFSFFLILKENSCLWTTLENLLLCPNHQPPYAGNGSTIPSAVPAKNPGVTPLFPPPDSPASPPGSIPMYPESIHVPSLFWSHYCHLSHCFTRYSHPTSIHLSESSFKNIKPTMTISCLKPPNSFTLHNWANSCLLGIFLPPHPFEPESWIHSLLFHLTRRYSFLTLTLAIIPSKSLPRLPTPRLCTHQTWLYRATWHSVQISSSVSWKITF